VTAIAAGHPSDHPAFPEGKDSPERCSRLPTFNVSFLKKTCACGYSEPGDIKFLEEEMNKVKAVLKAWIPGLPRENINTCRNASVNIQGLDSIERRIERCRALAARREGLEAQLVTYRQVWKTSSG
jgi:hypothetical protein